MSNSFNSLVNGSSKFLSTHNKRWGVPIILLSNFLASKKVVFKAFSACLVKGSCFFDIACSMLFF